MMSLTEIDKIIEAVWKRWIDNELVGLENRNLKLSCGEDRKLLSAVFDKTCLFATREAIRLTAKMIFAELEKARAKEVIRLKKYDDINWKKGNKEDGRKSTACVLTMGINTKSLINKEKKKW